MVRVVCPECKKLLEVKAPTITRASADKLKHYAETRIGSLSAGLSSDDIIAWLLNHPETNTK